MIQIWFYAAGASPQKLTRPDIPQAQSLWDALFQAGFEMRSQRPPLLPVISEQEKEDFWADISCKVSHLPDDFDCDCPRQHPY